MRVSLSIIILLFLSGLLAATPPYYNNKVVQEDNVIVKQKIVEFDADTYLGLEGYYTIQNEAVEKHGITSQIKKKDDQIDALIRLLEKKYGNSEPTPEKPQPEPEPELPPNEPTPVPTPPTNDSLEAKTFAIFKRSCASCHGPNQTSGKLKLIGRDAKGEYLLDVGLKSVRVYDRVKGTHLKERGLALMPPNKTPLTDEDVNIIHLWMVKTIDNLIDKKVN